jgi:hypothetical protein
MTTQIALLNMSGIAIASDTLASLRAGSAFKHSHGNSKIWVPSHEHKFVVYHSGSARFNSMPHQIHVEEWFRSLTKPLATLNDYAESYKRFCVSKNSPHTQESEIELIHNVWNGLSKILREHIDKATAGVDFDTPEGRKIWNDAIITEITEAGAYYAGIENFKGFTIAFIDETLAKYKINLKAKIKELFPEGTPVKFTNKAVTTFKKFLISKVTTDQDTTLTFAGYGTKDVYPSTRKIDFRGIINGKLQSEPNHELDLNPTKRTGGIVYGAQTDAIWGLIQGYRYSVQNTLDRILNIEIPESDEKEQLITKIIEELGNQTGDEYVSPAMARIVNHSLPELAETAQTMLNLQVLSAKLSKSQETVGGEIEVLTIDKINGIRWQNRI